MVRKLVNNVLGKIIYEASATSRPISKIADTHAYILTVGLFSID